METDLTERILQPISTGELERRWTAVRKAMAARGIDCLVMQNSNQFLGGYVRWFTDIPAENGYPVTAIFPIDDGMTTVTSGGKPHPPGPPEWAVRGVKERLASPYFRSLSYTDSLDADQVATVLASRGGGPVGIVGKGSLSAAFYEQLKSKLPQTEFVDASDLVDPIKAVKSPEEIVLTRTAARIQDTVWSALPAIARPGLREYEIRAEIQRMLVDLGSEEQMIRIGSAPSGERVGTRSAFFQNRILRPGDQLCVLIEVNGPGGFYAELGRTLCLGDPPEELQRAFAVAVEAQRHTVSQLMPGASPAEIFRNHNDFLAGRGYPAEGRLFAHGQGYDMVERPAIRSDETMLLAAGMNVAVHPFVLSAKGYGYCCDNFLITETGAERLHRTPLELFSV